MLKTDIIDNIHLEDAALNQIIQAYLDGPYYRGKPTTVNIWRQENYKDLRRWAYPEITIFNDAMVKINSGDSTMIAEGNVQLSQYYNDCLAVKTKFPKE